MAQGQTTIEGIYEVCIGVPEAISAIQYWEQFGYRIGNEGSLSASGAQQLYGVNSALRSIRLYHQNANYGLIRLMIWQNPTNQGLGIGSMKVRGNRWTTTFTTEILNILNHVEEARIAGWTIRYTYPLWEPHSQERKTRPFINRISGVRKMLLLQSWMRQVLFQKFGDLLSDEDNHLNSLLHTSPFTHMGMIIQDDSKQTLEFYEQVLGLVRVIDNVEVNYESSLAERAIFDLQPGEKFFVTAFDTPRYSQEKTGGHSCRLYIMRFPSQVNLISGFHAAQPGSLGMCLYTYKVREINYYFDRIKANPVQKFTTISTNEFGEISFSFVTPDGYFWTLL
ncbi:MAG: VOC family protein [Nostocaceae cyanobacterium]|nr:VOC family protein [Nostocaceae cyanobacterium]